MDNKYIPRLIDATLETYLKTFGAILIEGPKWCGKTTTAIQHSKSVLRMQDPAQGNNYMKIADSAPALLLEGNNPRLIDEWQVAPVLWDAIRSEVDRRSSPGQFILTGSVTPPSQQTMHSGTGRIARVVMRTMTLFESGESSGAVSIKELLAGQIKVQAISRLTIRKLAYLVCRGGWPQSLGTDEQTALLIAKEYAKSIYRNDFMQFTGTIKDPRRMQALLRSYARNTQTLAKNVTILKDIKSKDIDMSESTLYSYLTALEQLYIIEETPAWSPQIRSKTMIRTANKKGFTDPSIGCAVLGLTPEHLLRDFETFGFMFESLCIRDLRVYAEQNGGDVFHYRDQLGLECDAILRFADGRYALIEIKLGQKAEEVGALHLLKLESLLVEKGHDAPSFKMIVTGGEHAYTRADGIHVVPLGCLTF